MRDYSFGSVTMADACPPGDPCAHCRWGRPAQPVEAGDPRDLSMAVVDIDEHMRFAMPPAFHRPEFTETRSTSGWFCSCCWGADGVLHAWPCMVAERHGTYVTRVLRLELSRARRAGIAAAAR